MKAPAGSLNPGHVFRERGFSDGYAGRESRPPDDEKLSFQYRRSYKRGVEARADEERRTDA